MAAKKKITGPVSDGQQTSEPDDGYPLELLGFGKRLDRELRKRLGQTYTQTEASKRTGVSQPTISNLINKPARRYFQIDTVLKIAKALEISLDVLLLDRPDPWRIVAQNRRSGGNRIQEQPDTPAAGSPPTQRRKTEPQK